MNHRKVLRGILTSRNLHFYVILKVLLEAECYCFYEMSTNQDKYRNVYGEYMEMVNKTTS